MRSIIYKYQLERSLKTVVQGITVPMEAEFLDVQVQDGIITLWYRIPLNYLETSDFRTILCVWTGEMYDSKPEDKYLGTVGINSLIYHIFDITERERD